MILAAIWGFAVYFEHSRGRLRFLDRIESMAIDLKTLARGQRVPPDLVTIIAIDDNLVKWRGIYPLPRSDLTKIVDTVTQLQPKLIALDLLLVDNGAADADDALASSLAAGPSVIAGAAIFTEASQSISSDPGAGPLARLPMAERFLLPLKKFADHAAIGIANVATDQAGTPRSVPMLFRTADRVELSFPLRVASVALGKEPVIEPDRLTLGERSVPTDLDHALPIAFYGPRRTIRTISAATVLAGTISPGDIRGRIVVVGATVAGGSDFFSSPFDRLLPGVEVISTAINHLLAGDGPLRDQSVRFVDGVVAVLLPAILVGLLAWRRSAAGIVLATAVILVWVAANVLAFSAGIVMSAAIPIAAAAAPLVVFGSLQLWSGRRQAQYFATRSELLEQFQAPAVQKWLARDPNFLAEPVRQNAAVVFIDLSGFTSLSEQLGPDRTRDLLKEFHALVDREAVASQGMITSFLGDGAMLLFGLPAPAADDATRATECALNLCSNVGPWLQSLKLAGPSRLGFKVGAHFGLIVASRLGGGSYHHITATGDTVNVASRLMEVAAEHLAELAISDELLRAAGPDSALRKSGDLAGPVEARIRGRSNTLMIWLWRGQRDDKARKISLN